MFRGLIRFSNVGIQSRSISTSSSQRISIQRSTTKNQQHFVSQLKKEQSKTMLISSSSQLKNNNQKEIRLFSSTTPSERDSIVVSVTPSKPTNWKELLICYSHLGKFRLGSLVALTAMVFFKFSKKKLFYSKFLVLFFFFIFFFVIYFYEFIFSFCFKGWICFGSCSFFVEWFCYFLCGNLIGNRFCK